MTFFFGRSSETAFRTQSAKILTLHISGRSRRKEFTFAFASHQSSVCAIEGSLHRFWQSLRNFEQPWTKGTQHARQAPISQALILPPTISRQGAESDLASSEEPNSNHYMLFE